MTKRGGGGGGDLFVVVVVDRSVVVVSMVGRLLRVVVVVDRLVVVVLRVVVGEVSGRFVPSVGLFFNRIGLNFFSSTNRILCFFSHSRVWTCSRAGTSLFQNAHVSWLFSFTRTTFRLSSNLRTFRAFLENFGQPAVFPLPRAPAG